MSPENGLDSVSVVKIVSRETQKKLTDYHDLLIKWQSRINLISPNTIGEIWQRHIADSMQSVVHMDGARRVIDLGSGAGFPGLIMAIDLAERGGGKIDLIESNGKKCAFLNAAIRELDLKSGALDIQVHNGRIEEILPKLDQPDLISARALGSLNDLLTLTHPKLEFGAFGLFPKGKGHDQEIKEAEKNWHFSVDSHPSRLEDGSVVLKISGVHPR